MLIRLLLQKGIGGNVNLEETIGEYECSKVPQALFESNGSMRQGCKVDNCAERDSLEDEGEIIRYRLEDGFHTFGTSIFDGAASTRTFTMIYKLRVASKCPCYCSCAKCQVPRCAACKCKGNDTKKCGRLIFVRTLLENNTVTRVTQMTQNDVIE